MTTTAISVSRFSAEFVAQINANFVAIDAALDTLVDGATHSNLAINTSTVSGATSGYVLYSVLGVLQNFALGTGVQTFLTTPTSANLKAAITDETGSGALVFADTPTLVTPDIGAATGTSASVTGTLAAYTGTAPPAGGTTGSGIKLSSTANFGVFFGSGAPTLTAARGSLYLRSDGTPYYNTDGATTWVAVGSGGGLSVGTSVISSGTSGRVLYDDAGVLGELATTGTGLVVLAASPALSGTPTIAGATSGTIGLVATAIAGSNTLTLPAATDTLVGKATTDTLTNKTYDTAGAGNVFKINGNTVSDVTGTGNTAVLSASPTLTGTTTVSSLRASSGTIWNQTAGTNGSVALASGDGTHSGYIEFRLPSAASNGGTRLGYMGYDTTNVTLTLENGAGFVVTGGGLTAPSVNATNGIYVGNATIGTSYSIPSGSNAMSVSPVSISSGVVVTVPSGSRWAVV